MSFPLTIRRLISSFDAFNIIRSGSSVFNYRYARQAVNVFVYYRRRVGRYESFFCVGHEHKERFIRQQSFINSVDISQTNKFYYRIVSMHYTTIYTVLRIRKIM